MIVMTSKAGMNSHEQKNLESENLSYFT